MSEVLGGLVNWLVVERKADGRCVYDEAAKAELVVLCGQPGASVSKLARQAGVNANQLWRWVREHARRRPDATAGSAGAKREVFVAMPVAVAASLPASSGGDAFVTRPAQNDPLLWRRRRGRWSTWRRSRS